ncbi:hypothetical protein [Leptothermofonsia sp. ETS-13]|uniref:hypothetical protein n=1 Tax=Leptothermofonsia sp. ETS-13 TaxID=3035696 RepID=UPI003BA313CF
MAVKRAHYEELLAEYSNSLAAIGLLKRYRPYLELLPSMRRPGESLITIPLPVIKLRNGVSLPSQSGIYGTTSKTLCLPCDIAILMCDPEWKIKMGIEIFIFIHRPEEDFSNLLGRWRQTQVLLSRGYEWEMPLRYRHILSEGADTLYPLFVLFEETPERIKRGLRGAFLPFVTQMLNSSAEEAVEPSASEVLWGDQEARASD